mmetsp:Transcript_48569/g.106104  ORF Transcript_48569/g.106104 Transcript_48569/m.106104 type:complete len:228 (-) Transcript_48569:52-735(-)
MKLGDEDCLPTLAPPTFMRLPPHSRSCQNCGSEMGCCRTDCMFQNLTRGSHLASDIEAERLEQAPSKVQHGTSSGCTRDARQQQRLWNSATNRRRPWTCLRSGRQSRPQPGLGGLKASGRPCGRHSHKETHASQEAIAEASRGQVGAQATTAASITMIPVHLGCGRHCLGQALTNRKQGRRKRWCRLGSPRLGGHSAALWRCHGGGTTERERGENGSEVAQTVVRNG